MTALEEIKKALEGVTPVTWSYQFTEENGEVFIIANELGGLIGAALPWPTEVEEKDFRRVVSYAKYIVAVNPAAISELLSTLESLRREKERLRQFLFPYADRTDISGISWDGKYLIGDKASITAFHEMKNRGEQIDVYKRAYDQNEAALKARAEAAEAEVKRLRDLVWRAREISRPSVFPTWHKDANEALASTGGEHHAE